jgi:hypothetical protein
MAARDFLEADEILSLLVAGEIVDNPVRPETAAGGGRSPPVTRRRAPYAS